MILRSNKDKWLVIPGTKLINSAETAFQLISPAQWIKLPISLKDTDRISKDS